MTNQITENERQTRLALNWFLHGETGLSSIAIVRAWSCNPPAVPDGPWDHPLDAGDLRRCVQLLEECPFIDIKIMRGKSIYWDALLDHWGLLMKVFLMEWEMVKAERRENCKMTYYLMKALFEIADDEKKRAEKESTDHYIQIDDSIGGED